MKDIIPEKGLIIGPKWAEMIVSGNKRWELRKKNTKSRGDIAIIAQGTGTIVGKATVTDCIGPMDLDELMAGKNLAGETEPEIIQDVKDGYVYAWVLENPVKFEKPVPYKHPSGAVTWVNLQQPNASDFTIVSGITLGEDFDRVGNKLSAQTISKGAPEYAPLSHTFKAVASDGCTLGEAIVTQNWGKLELDLMHVEPEHRGKGIGKSLMKVVEEFVKANDLKAIRLNTPTWQGVGFYERCGYKEMGRIPLASDENGNQHSEVTYVKTFE